MKFYASVDAHTVHKLQALAHSLFVRLIVYLQIATSIQ